ncbi:MAG TPA: 2-amino-4-hydroxy-6-hydroxymethyldihydropteridine diphosphokinase [Armatimonadota bacterium]|jgi:dihydroneopterin aldolase/2-amino-4-hydroxy-6-hydroxymethyldihydropteridine diphosphokinase
MARVFLGVGANIHPEVNILAALQRLQEQVMVVGVSTFYLTAPIGHPEQPPFVNGVVEALTDLPPWELKYTVLRPIESALGRRRSDDAYAARPIDLDLLLYDEVVVSSAELALPDPDITRRAFLAIPLCELAPDIVLPGSRQGICALAQACPATPMEALPVLTAQLRELISRPIGRKERQV